MSAESKPARPTEDEQLDAWVAEQKKKFKPGDMDPFIQVMRTSRARRLREQQGSGAA